MLEQLEIPDAPCSDQSHQTHRVARPALTRQDPKNSLRSLRNRLEL